MKSHCLSQKTDARAFSILEVMIALGIISFCLVTLLALLPIGIAANQSSLSQTEATSIASGVISDLRNPPESGGRSQRFKIDIPSAMSSPTPDARPVTLYFMTGGMATGGVGQGPTALTKYRVNLWFIPPGSSHKGSTQVRILITWPGKADPDPNLLPQRFTGSLEMVTALTLPE